MNTALNRTTIAFLTNKSGGALTYGDVVVLDNTNDNGFTTTTSAALSTRGLGVILDVAGIANNATGAVAIGGWCPQINLNTAATVGQFIHTHTVAGQGTPHDAPQDEGDFAVALTASATPPAMLFGSPNGPSGGGAGTVTTTGSPASGNLTQFSGATSITNGDLSGDVSTSGTLVTAIGANKVTTTTINNSAVTLAKIANAAANSVLVGSGAAGSGSAYAEIALGTNLSMSGTTLNAAGGSGAVALITETVTSGSASNVTFSGISSSYRDLIIRVRGRGDTAAAFVNLYLQFNGDTGANYNHVHANAFATLTSAQTIGATQLDMGIIAASTATASYSGGIQVTILNYIDTTFFKSCYSNGGASTGTGANSQCVNISYGLWRSASAITSVKVFLAAGNFVDNSVVSLYGSL